MTDMPVGRRLRAARESLGLSRVEVARAAGINRNTLAAIETARHGHHNTSLHKIENALRNLGADLDEVVVEPVPIDHGQVTFTATFASRPDLTVSVEGPVAVADRLADSLARLCRSFDAEPQIQPH